MKLKNKQTAVFGMKGEGKSNWVQYALNKPQYSDHLIYDVTREHEDFNRYLPEFRRGDKADAELNGVVERLITRNDRDKRPSLFVIEEFSRFCSPHSPPPSEVYELIDMLRHYGIGLMTVARRPAQVHTDTLELADSVIVFHLQGPNDVRKLNNYRDGLGDLVKQLGKYQYVRVSGRDYQVKSPVDEMDSTGEI